MSLGLGYTESVHKRVTLLLCVYTHGILSLPVQTKEPIGRGNVYGSTSYHSEYKYRVQTVPGNLIKNGKNKALTVV